jgi:hypothetical protein
MRLLTIQTALLAAFEWRDERGMTWLESAPKIKLFPVTDARKPHSLSVEEQY